MDDKVVPASDRTIHAFKPTHFPGLMLTRDLKDESNAVELFAAKAINGISAIHIRVTDTKASANTLEAQQEDWYFDQTSSLPLRVEYSTPGFNSLEVYVNVAVEWSQYGQLGGFLIPQTTKRIIEGGPTTICSISSFTVNNGQDDSVFALKPRNQ